MRISLKKILITRVELELALFEATVEQFNHYATGTPSVLLYDCTNSTKHIEKKLDGNYSKFLHAVLNQSWKQHPTKQLLYSHLLPITQIIQVKWTRYTGHYWRKIGRIFIMDSNTWTLQCWPTSRKLTFINFVRTPYVD